MKDENNPKDPIEKLFREKAEQYNISYREEDWLKLEKQLDVRDMQRYYRRRMRWLAAASILILSLIGYYTLQNHNKINQLTEQLSQSEVVEQSEEPVNESHRMTAQSRSANRDAANQEDNIINNETDTEDDNLNENQIVRESSEELLATQEELKEIETGRSDQFAAATQITERRPIDSVSPYANRDPKVFLSDYVAEPVSVGDRTYSRPFEAEVSLTENSAIALFDDGSSDERPFRSALSRLAVGVVVSPDLSTVGAVSNFDNPGFKGGVVAEYALSKNISVVSGVAISNVKYKASGSEYNPPGAWNYGMLPDQTTAVCLVLDIPLNLKANIFNFDRSRIFTSAGVSSYIMLNEDYQFSYNGDASGLETSWSKRTGTTHWLSNAGFSIGFEYDLSSSWTIRAEPHIKIPLKGVGWGDVDLYSMGSLLSLNYRFDR